MVFVTGEADAVGPVSRASAPGVWCGQCGAAVDSGSHARCAKRAELEPPRWCVHCRRRLKVQVTPGAWTATCVQHGTVEQPTWG